MSVVKNLKRPSDIEIGASDELPFKIEKIACRRKMCAVLMMYSGWGFYGMLRSPVFPTIEGELAKALVAVGQLEDISTEEFRKANFQRASKTDKSVSAIGQVCSMMLKEDTNVVESLNANLPQCIRIIDIVRATKKFNAKNSCCHRVYDYFIPTFAFSPSDLGVDYWQYRVTAERLTLVNNILHRFVGTHNFFNFTSGRLPDDKSCYRYIISFECLPTFLLGEHEYTILRVTGQSFMLHQIRKMIGLMLGILRGYTDESAFEIAYGNKRIDVPKAPGLGLMLNEVVYDRYNKRYGGDNIHSPISFEKYETERNQFKMEFVYKHIDKVEFEEKSMFEWLQNLGRHNFSYRSHSPNANSTTSVVPDETSVEVKINPTESPLVPDSTDRTVEEQSLPTSALLNQ